jgi:hypothetical protein
MALSDPSDLAFHASSVGRSRALSCRARTLALRAGGSAGGATGVKGTAGSVSFSGVGLTIS